MKKIIFGIFLCILVAGLTGCTKDPRLVIRGTITQLTDEGETIGILVEGEKESDTEYGKAQVRVNKKTKIYHDGKKVNITDLKENMVVEVYYDGAVAESYPVQMGSEKIVILEMAEENKEIEEDEEIQNEETIELPAVKGVITEYKEENAGICMLVEGQQPVEAHYDKAYVRPSEETKIVKEDGTKLSLEDLTEGIVVEVYYEGPVNDSYPVQMGADKIVVLDEQIAIRGIISSLTANEEYITMLVEEEKEEEDTAYDKASVTIEKDVLVYKGEEKVSTDELVGGMKVEVYFDGVAALSYPVQIGAYKIVILDYIVLD